MRTSVDAFCERLLLLTPNVGTSITVMIDETIFFSEIAVVVFIWRDSSTRDARDALTRDKTVDKTDKKREKATRLGAETDEEKV